MPNDLTAAQLIQLLREHPLTCGALEIEIDDDYFEDGTNEVYIGTCDQIHEALNEGFPFHRWLTGALVEAHVERELPLPTQWCDLKWSSGNDAGIKPLSEWTKHETLLHALLAGLESHLKETT